MTQHGMPDERRPSVVAATAGLENPGQHTPGLRRLQAFGGEGRWVGVVRSEPGEWSAWHHHGENDSYFYVLRGRLEFEYGRDGDVLSVGPAEFGHLPANLVHRERTAPGDPGEVVLVRVGRGPMVVDAEGPG